MLLRVPAKEINIANNRGSRTNKREFECNNRRLEKQWNVLKCYEDQALSAFACVRGDSACISSGRDCRCSCCSAVASGVGRGWPAATSAAPAAGVGIIAVVVVFVVCVSASGLDAPVDALMPLFHCCM